MLRYPSLRRSSDCGIDCLSACLCLCLCLSLFVCVCVCLSVDSFVCLPIRLFVRLFIWFRELLAITSLSLVDYIRAFSPWDGINTKIVASPFPQLHLHLTSPYALWKHCLTTAGHLDFFYFLIYWLRENVYRTTRGQIIIGCVLNTTGHEYRPFISSQALFRFPEGSPMVDAHTRLHCSSTNNFSTSVGR